MMLSRYTVAALVAWCLSTGAHAAPANDDWASRTVVQALPFSTTVPSIVTATVEPTDPIIFCVDLGQVSQQLNTVWFAYTPGSEDEYINISTAGYDTLVAVVEGGPASGFRQARGGCNDDAEGNAVGASLRGIRLKAGHPYSIVVARFTGSSTADPVLSFSMSASPKRVVTKTADTNDGVCDNDCSLREALAANTPANAGAIFVPAGHYVVPGGLVTTNSGFGLYGDGMDRTVIDANGSGRVLELFSVADHSSTFLLEGLSLVNGLASGPGGALSSRKSYVVLDRVAIRGNTSTSTSGGGGAALSQSIGTASIFDSVFANNHATQGGGRGLVVDNDHVEMDNVTIVSNDAFSSNDESGGGGVALFVRHLAQLNNVTIAENRSDGRGGGMYARLRSSASLAAFRNLTVTANHSNVAGTYPPGGGIFLQAAGSAPPIVPLANSVIHGNRDGALGDLQDCQITGPLTLSTGFDFVGAAGGCVFTAVGDVVNGSDPQLSALPDIAGALPVRVPNPGSPLIDSGEPSSACGVVDARNLPRPVDGNGDGIANCDIGAAERQLVEDRLFANGFE